MLAFLADGMGRERGWCHTHTFVSGMFWKHSCVDKCLGYIWTLKPLLKAIHFGAWLFQVRAMTCTSCVMFVMRLVFAIYSKFCVMMRELLISYGLVFLPVFFFHMSFLSEQAYIYNRRCSSHYMFAFQSKFLFGNKKKQKKLEVSTNNWKVDVINFILPCGPTFIPRLVLALPLRVTILW